MSCWKETLTFLLYYKFVRSSSAFLFKPCSFITSFIQSIIFKPDFLCRQYRVGSNPTVEECNTSRFFQQPPIVLLISYQEGTKSVWRYSSDEDMGVGKIFSREGPLGDFPKLFQGGTQNGEICFFPLKTNKTTFFARNFEFHGGRDPPAFPSDAHGWKHISCEIFVVTKIKLPWQEQKGQTAFIFQSYLKVREFEF